MANSWTANCGSLGGCFETNMLQTEVTICLRRKLTNKFESFITASLEAEGF